jgi:hypothetical protein
VKFYVGLLFAVMRSRTLTARWAREERVRG